MHSALALATVSFFQEIIKISLKKFKILEECSNGTVRTE